MVELLECPLGDFLHAVRTAPSMAFPEKKIVVNKVGLPSMRQPFSWKEVPRSLYEGIDLVDFVELAEEAGVAGAAIEGTDYAMIAFPDHYPRLAHRDDVVWIADMCLRTVPKNELMWCRPLMHVFHYA